MSLLLLFQPQKYATTSLSSNLSFTGNIALSTKKTLSAALSFLGSFSLGSNFVKALTSTLSFTGSITRQIAHKLTAGLSFTGAILRAITKGLTGATLSFAGAITKLTTHLSTGVLSFTGAFAKGYIYFKTFPATISFAGVFRKLPIKNLTANLTFTTSITRFMKIYFRSTLSFTGQWLGFIKPIFFPLTKIINSRNQDATVTEDTTENIGTGGTIEDMNTNDTDESLKEYGN